MIVKLREDSFLALVSTDSLVCSNDTDKDGVMGPPVLSGHWPHYRSRAPAAFKYKAAQNDSPNERFSAAWTNCDIALCGADDKQFTESSHISTVSTVHYAALYQLCLPKRTNAPCYSSYCRCLGRCEGPDLAMGHGDPRLLSPPCHAAPLLPRCHQRSFQPANNSF